MPYHKEHAEKCKPPQRAKQILGTISKWLHWEELATRKNEWTYEENSFSRAKDPSPSLWKSLEWLESSQQSFQTRTTGAANDWNQKRSHPCSERFPKDSIEAVAHRALQETRRCLDRAKLSLEGSNTLRKYCASWVRCDYLMSLIEMQKDEDYVESLESLRLFGHIETHLNPLGCWLKANPIEWLRLMMTFHSS